MGNERCSHLQRPVAHNRTPISSGHETSKTTHVADHLLCMQFVFTSTTLLSGPAVDCSEVSDPESVSAIAVLPQVEAEEDWFNVLWPGQQIWSNVSGQQDPGKTLKLMSRSNMSAGISAFCRTCMENYESRRRHLTCSAKSMTPLMTVSLSVDTAKTQLRWMLSAMTTVCTLVSGGMM